MLVTPPVVDTMSDLSRSTFPGRTPAHMPFVCVSCGQTSFTRRLMLEPYAYVACRECGLIRLDPLPSEEQASRLYAREYFEEGAWGGYRGYDADATLHQRNARRRLTLVEAHAPRTSQTGRRIIDVGCGTGYVLLEARNSGWHTVGVDVSPWVRETAGSRGIRVERSLEAVSDEEASPADVVTFFQSLEHMPRPDMALRQARERLRPGGIVVLETWDTESRIARLMGRHWQQATPPSVLYLFGRRTLTRLLQATGFRVRVYRAASKYVSVGLVSGLLSHKYPALRWADRLLRRTGIASWGFRYSLGDLVTVVAVRD